MACHPCSCCKCGATGLSAPLPAPRAAHTDTTVSGQGHGGCSRGMVAQDCCTAACRRCIGCASRCGLPWLHRSAHFHTKTLVWKHDKTTDTASEDTPFCRFGRRTVVPHHSHTMNYDCRVQAAAYCVVWCNYSGKTVIGGDIAQHCPPQPNPPNTLGTPYSQSEGLWRWWACLACHPCSCCKCGATALSAPLPHPGPLTLTPQ